MSNELSGGATYEPVDGQTHNPNQFGCWGFQVPTLAQQRGNKP